MRRVGAAVRLIVACALVVVAAWLVATTIQAVVHLHHPLPFWDQWDALTDVDRFLDGQYTLRDLVRPHNEHRIAVPRLFFLLDHLLFGGTSVFLLVCNLLIQAGHAGLLMRLAWPLLRTSWARIAGGALLVGTLFSSTQIENLIWGFQLQFVLVYLAFTVSQTALVQAVRGPRATVVAAWTAVCLVAAIVCNFTMANGLLVWPLLLTAAWVLRASRWTVLAIAAAGVAAGVGFFVGYRPGAGVQVAQAVARLPEVAGFVGTFLGNPLWKWPAAAAGVGVVALAVGVTVLALLCRRRHALSPSEVVLGHVLLFVLGTAALAGVGRLHLAPEVALSGRYSTATLIYWAVLGLLYLATFRRIGSVLGTDVVLAAVAVVLAGLLTAQPHGFTTFAQRPLAQEQVALALLLGVRDDQALAKTHGLPPATILAQASILLRRNETPFDWPERDWPGRPLQQLFAVRDGGVRGEFEAAATIPATPAAIRVSGWAWDPATGVPPKRVLLVDQSGLVRGLAASGWPRPDVAGGEQASGGWGWRGYCHVPAHEQAVVRAYAVAANGREVNPLSGAWDSSLALETVVPIDGVGSELLAVDTVASGGWTADGGHPGAPKFPLPGAVYGSWSGSDATVGRIVIGPFAVTGRRAVVLPFLTGPDGHGLSVRMKEVASGKVLAELQDPKADPNRWFGWRIEVPAGRAGAQLIFEAEDAGVAWGQWLAVAQPRWGD